MRGLFLMFVLWASLASASAAEGPAGFDPRYAPAVGPSLLQDENAYVLTVAEADPATRAALAERPEMRRIAQAVLSRLTAAARACERLVEARYATPPEAAKPEVPTCDPAALRWTAAEAEVAAEAAGRAFDASPAVRALVGDHLRPSGRYVGYAGLSDRALFLRAWRDAHAGLDRMIRVYALGETPRFADIDSPIYPVAGRYYRHLLANLVRETAIALPADAPAWEATRRFAFDLMDFNRRDDLDRLRPLEERENAPAARRLARIDWSDHPYTAVLVPGYSPEVGFEPLNPGAELRMRRGVALWREGRAPVIVVSGGTLRPVGTDVNEALSMKRRLVERHGVPADAILIDPLARHTTTNVRNTVRLLARHGAPLDRPALIAGNSVPYIASERFRERCLRELGYLPFVPGRRLAFDAMEFRPELRSLHRDPADPMDP